MVPLKQFSEACVCSPGPTCFDPLRRPCRSVGIASGKLDLCCPMTTSSKPREGMGIVVLPTALPCGSVLQNFVEIESKFCNLFFFFFFGNK